MLQYLKRNSPLHFADARLKLIVLAAINIALFATIELTIVLSLFILVLLAYFAARVSPLQSVKELGPVWIFVVLPLVLVLLVGEPLLKGIVVSTRLVAVMLFAMLFIYTTKQREIARALVYFKVPATVALMLTMAFRFLPLIQKEVGRVRAAQMARGYERGWLVVPIIVPVLRRAFVRARHLGMSMDARGFDVEKIAV